MEWLEGTRLVARQRALLVLFTFLAVTGVGEGIFGTMMVIFVNRVLHASGSKRGCATDCEVKPRKSARKRGIDS